MSLLRKHCLIFGRPNQSAFLQEEIKNETLYERAARVLRQFTSNVSFILDHIANYCCFFCFSNHVSPIGFRLFHLSMSILTLTQLFARNIMNIYHVIAHAITDWP